jgi:hypothetical protein
VTASFGENETTSTREGNEQNFGRLVTLPGIANV